MLTPSPDRSSEGDETEQNQRPDLQVHSFRWVQFEENIKMSYQQLREKKLFNDVTISCENLEVEAHKVVLATSSDFFSRLLERSSFRNNLHPIIFINDVKMKHLMFIMDFMYAGEVNVPQNDTTSVLQAAKELEIKGFQTDDFNDLNPVATGIRKRQVNEFSYSSTLSSPEKRSRSDSRGSSPSSRGSSPICLQPKINLEETSFIENEWQENAEDDSQEKDKDDRQENVEDDSQEKDEEDSQENAVEDKLKKDQDDGKDIAKDDMLENVNQSVTEPSQLCNAVILEKAVSTSPSSDEKMNSEMERAASVEKVGSGLSRCNPCDYTSKPELRVKKNAEGHPSPRQYISNDEFSVKKQAESHLSPRHYKCHLCPAVVKNEVYFKDHMIAKHGIKLKRACWLKKE